MSRDDYPSVAEPDPIFAEVDAVDAASLRYQSELDAFCSRNQAALDASIEQSRREFEAGAVSRRTIRDIVADRRRRFGGPVQS
jgi:hypothetical protein